MTTTILLVRHGQTDWNKTERFRGRTDVPLNETGLAQATLTGQRISAWRPSAVYTSPLTRAVQTGESIAGCCGLAISRLPGLIDLNFGKWEGLTPGEVQALWPDRYQAWLSSPQSARIPGGETLEELQARGIETVQAASSRHPGETIVLVGHLHINLAILLGVVGLDLSHFWNIRQDNCGINIFEIHQSGTILVSLNETFHLITGK